MGQHNLTDFDGKLADLNNCRVRRSSNGLDECLVNENCQWSLHTMNGKYCANPSMPVMDISDCRVHVDGMGVAECMAAGSSCQYGVSQGVATMCLHPFAIGHIAQPLKKSGERRQSITTITFPVPVVSHAHAAPPAIE